MLQVKIMRGLPGSGKTTLANKMAAAHGPPVVVLSADNFHIEADGVYRFKQENAASAHGSCLNTFAGILEAKMYENDDDSWLFIVDNTNTTAVEIAPYYQLALAYGADVEIIQVEVDGGWQVAAQRNIHNVPLSTILRMQTNLLTEKFPSWWKVSVVVVP